ncbi:MAG: threonine--tRNA ligase [Bacteriovoracaceae bacterium]|nr:threonine--tRNA ligase [Bacteriovoracaceae bacterium]
MSHSPSKNYDLSVLRHSAAHIMAQAIQEVFPKENVQFGIGPVTEHGFYYDIDMNHRLVAEDLIKIETQMRQIIKRKIPIKRHEITREAAVAMFQNMNQTLKVELIRDLPEGEVITYYTHEDQFLDLCRGPHIENTGDLPPNFKLLQTAGAYWRGDQTRPMLQRVYAAYFSKQEELDQYLNFLEEAKKRDHRKLGKELELFIFDPVAPASPFFMPKGAFLYNSLVEFMRRVYKRYDYQEVITPQVLDVELWHTSGHYQNYHENMYFTKVDEREFALKPMNCPCHMLMFSHFKYSYRDLPLRYADFGRLHRYERSGVVTGLTRVRTFCQDDAHIFLAQEQIQNEIKALLEMIFICYEHFGFKKVKVNLSTRPEKRMGAEELWDKAESDLRLALEQSGHKFEIKEGDGAFYGPKIDIEVADAIERYYQLGTIQLDFQLPERFQLKFTQADGQEVRPVVIHRALLGSLERFLGVYIEHVAGAFPFWLAPEQIYLVPINNEKHLAYAQNLQKVWSDLGLRVKIDDRNETLGLKTRQIQMLKVPYMIVIGDKEMEQNQLAVRKYGDPKNVIMPLVDAQNLFLQLDAEKIPAPWR